MIGDRWGVSDAEVARTYACDAIVARPVLQAWRGVSVRASAAQVWPWVAQIRVGAVLSYLLVPVDDTASRLLLKIVLARGRLLAPALSAGDLVMARRQLRRLAHLAESARTSPTA